MSKHIVIDAREYSTSSGRYVRNLLKYLENIDAINKYTVLIHEHDTSVYNPSASNFTKKVVPFTKFSWSEQTTFRSFLNQLKPDLVHFTFAQQPVLYRKPKVTTIHDLTALRFNLAVGASRLVSPFKRAVFSWMIKSAAKKSKHLVTPSKFVKDDVQSTFKIKPNKITVTLEAADAFTDKTQIVESVNGKKFLLYVGRAQIHKNLPALIDTLQILRKHNPDLYLVLAGKKDSAYQALEDLVTRKKIENVIFTDFVSEGQLRWLYEHTAAYVFPSLSEGFGLPPLEAMIHGAPVVSSNASCLPEISGDAALYFNPTDVEDIAHKIDRVLTDKAFRNELIARGHKQAAIYSWGRMAEETLAVYTKVLDR